ncbi:hypothetical protein F9K33_16125 [bacterium]|nr:MAG: hypothetical protein F9K33_16125 [bacterium]
MINLIIFSLNLFTSTAPQTESGIFGSWKATKLVAGYVTTNEDADAVIGEEMILSDSLFDFLDWDERNPQYEIKTVKTSTYFPVFRYNAIYYGINSDSIIVITVRYKQKGQRTTLFLDGNRLIAPIYSHLLFFEKIK